jgi:hypothetical protein
LANVKKIFSTETAISDKNVSIKKKNDEKRSITPRRVIRFTSKLQGM